MKSILKNRKKRNQYLSHSIASLFLLMVVFVAILYLFNIYQWSSAPFFGHGVRKYSGWAIVGRVYDDGFKAGFRIGDRILEVNKQPVKSLASLRQFVHREIGALNEFKIERGGQKHIILYRTNRFGLGRSAVVFGLPWLIGILIIFIGSFSFYTTSIDTKKWSFFLFCLCAGLVMIFFNQRPSFPTWIQVFEIMGFCFMPAAILHMAFISPFYEEYKQAHFIFTLAGYTVSLVLFIIIKTISVSFTEAPKSLRIVVLIYTVLSILTFICVLIYQNNKKAHRLAKLKIRVILFGFFISVLLPLAEPVMNTLFGIFIFPNIELAMLPFIIVFPLSIAYAIAKHDLFEIDVFIKRTAGYLLATAFIALFYLIFVFSVNLFLKTVFFRHQHAFNFLFILSVVFFFNPITSSVQNFVNRIFFRQKYDYKEPVKQLLKDMTSIFELDMIILRIFNILTNTMFIEDIHIFLYSFDEEAYCEYDPHSDSFINKSGKVIPSASSLVKLLIKEKKEIQIDRFYGPSKTTPSMKEVFRIFKSWRAQLILPLITHDKLSGFMMLGNIKSGRYYNISDLEFLRIIADQTAIAMENVNLIRDKIEQEKIEEDLKIAGVIQRRMLPETAPDIEDFAIYNQIIPSQEIGGDFYDFVEVPSQTGKELGIVMGDISGHGISGALLMSVAHSICQNLVLYLRDVPWVMQELNRLMIKETKKKAFVACIYALLFPDKRIVFSNAGLPPPLYYNHHKKETRFIKNKGERLPVGIFEGLSYTPLTLSLNKGDVILFYTDGILEVRNKHQELYNFNRLEALFSRLVHLDPEEIYNCIINELRDFSGKKHFDDDMTMIILKHVDSIPLDTMLSLPVASSTSKIIVESVLSLAKLFSFTDHEIARIKKEVKKSYSYVEKNYQSIEDYQFVVSLFPDGEGLYMVDGHSPKEGINLRETFRMIGDYYCIELLPKHMISATISDRSISRLIVNFMA